MFNDSLHAFVQVIDAGSFTKAADKLYISPTALMKQMNGLEAQLGVQLLIRTHHGISATSAGTSFYHDAKFLIEYSEKAMQRARQAAHTNPYHVRIGTSMLNPCNILLDLWNPISATYPQIKIKMVPFEDDAQPWPGVYRTLGKDFDVMVGAYEQVNDAFQALKLGEYRFCVAVSREHPLARKDRLALSDLHGERLVLFQPGSSPLFDAIQSYVATEHQGIRVKYAPHQYTIEMFNLCAASGVFLLTLEGWKDVHPSLVTLPVDWDYTLPYGVLYPRKPANHVQLFVQALQATGFADRPHVPIAAN